MVISEPEGVDVPEIADFNVWREHGMYLAKHTETGREIEAQTVRQLEIMASVVRLSVSMMGVWTGRPIS